ncbi:MAG: hypothetical protein H6707_18840 [Deltaproteobacteria bacterium]|nr:hypothetical protein [Deltaproteobacteria bacterium]
MLPIVIAPETEMENLFFHPKVVHLPIALAVLMPLIAGGLLLAWWRKWLPPRSWLLAIALQAILVGSAIIALQTGEAEEDRVERIVAKPAIKKHEEAAEVFVWVGAGVLGLMLVALAVSRGKAGLPAAALATLGTLAVLGLGYLTGNAGGDLVYRHNAGAAYTGSLKGAPQSPAATPKHHDDHDDHDD